MPTKKQTQAGQATKSPEDSRRCAAAPGSVFELIELQQCEDNYYPLGIFLTLADAVAMVEKHGVGVCNNDPDEWAGVEIKQRRIGLSDNGRTVWKRSWERDWSDDNANDKWKVITPSQNTEVTNAGSKPESL
jgi:hypothetical protein